MEWFCREKGENLTSARKMLTDKPLIFMLEAKVYIATSTETWHQCHFAFKKYDIKSKR
jgi:hypothetical protein